MPIRFDKKKFVISNKDGIKTEVFGSGNQHHATFSTKSGHTVIKGDEGYEYAIKDESGKLRPSGIALGDWKKLKEAGIHKDLRLKKGEGKEQALLATKDWKPRWKQRLKEKKELVRLARASASANAGAPSPVPPATQTTGTRVGLCVIIQFPDVAGTITQQQVIDFCNQPGYTGFGNNGSVRDYFYDNSNGLLTYTNVVTTYYTAANNRAYYTDPAIPLGTRARELITEALNWLVAQGFDFSSLSVDGSGYIYALNIFYAGGLVNSWNEGLWPHSWSLATPFSISGGKYFYDYQITNMGVELTLFTFCHENAHMVCDFPDLYDYGDESNGCGNYCLMSAIGYDKNPPNVCAYLKYKAGWVNVQMISSTSYYVIYYDGQIDNQNLIGGLNIGNQKEYFVTEFRSNSGRDAILSGSGYIIYHVDEDGSNDNEQMTELLHYECSVEQADGLFNLENKVNNGDAGDFFGPLVRNYFSRDAVPGNAWWDGTGGGWVGGGGWTIEFRQGLPPVGPGDSTGKEGLAVLEYTIDQATGIPANTPVRYRLYGKTAFELYNVEVNRTGKPGATYKIDFGV